MFPQPGGTNKSWWCRPCPSNLHILLRNMSSSHRSPNDAFKSQAPPTRLPSLDFLYRLDCVMSPKEYLVGKPSNSQTSRVILPISGGTVSGPRINGTIVAASGADWATTLHNESVSISRVLMFCNPSLMYRRPVHEARRSLHASNRQR